MRNHSLHRFSIRIALLGLTCCIAAAAYAQTAAAPVAAASSPRQQIQPVDFIVAVVNSEVITQRELLSRLSDVEKRLSAQGGAMPPRGQLQKQVLERMIVERAQAQLAKESGVAIDDTMLDRGLTRIAEQNKLTLVQLRAQLEHDGMNYASFREDIRREMLTQRLREREVDNKVQVLESEVDNYLAAEKNTQATQELNVAQILITTPENASPEQLLQRRERAEDVLRQLKTGGDFAKLAAVYSDSTDALQGGDLGWRAGDRLPELFVTAVASLQPGQVSALVRSNNGFHILKLLGRRSAGAASIAALPAVQQTHVRHILIKLNQVVTANDARRKLLEIKDRLDHKAATFEELAKLYSNDLSASKGGDLGWVYPGDTVPEFERAMDKLKPGEISEPVETPFGFHLIEVVERKTDDASKERQRQAARQALRERKIQEATDDWMRQVRDNAYVEYRNDQD
ncbi:peptidylprolyl isomerase [Herbaspirillum sp. RTI4]|uniref:peptidylprolyl isomerase n=1 Tax=Herbaspirillum sp. RTI4 TaxID=3048640 RepID=UPI002AB5052B|nr:peptidylprolyl isomerase [Herbaspirillum sp. RTI4]MDY7576764.1 peptidylprolyl isomerase [Herbaspirillum sp. RTI4]MEA9981360.1 peptidylprolyl isomerase [Herbaspirillum sp. RTI4]